jgi:hypothetical protein
MADDKNTTDGSVFAGFNDNVKQTINRTWKRSCPVCVRQSEGVPGVMHTREQWAFYHDRDARQEV